MNKSFSLIATTTAIILFSFSCQKSFNTGDDLLPDDDNISIIFTDTSTIISETVLSVPSRTDRLLLNHLGCMDDPLFGKTSAMTSFELGLPIAGLDEDTLGPYSIDSFVLKVDINDFYGDSSQAQYFNVFTVVNNQEKLIDYYSDEVPPLDLNPIVSLGPHIPSLAKRLRINEGGDSSFVDPSLRFEIDHTVGQLILDNLGNIEDFKDFERLLPGLAIAVDSSRACGGGLYLLNLLSLSSSLRLHYKNSVNDTLVMFFPTFNSGYSRAVYEHNYTNTEVGMAINDGVNNEEKSYVQGLAGVQTKIEMPHLENYSGTAINKAEIVITQIPDASAETYTVPERIYLTTRDNQNLIRNIDDFSFGDAYYGGIKDSILNADEEYAYTYTINVSSHIQEIIDGKSENNALYITTIPEQVYDGGSTNFSILLPDRLILGGSNNPVDNSKIKLNLKYTNIE